MTRSIRPRLQRSNARASAMLAAAALLCGGCVTSGAPREHALPPTRWVEASPGLQDQIDEHSERLPWTHGADRVELIRWFAGAGEPAYPRLLELAMNESTSVASSALAALGATRDQRLVTSVRALPPHPSGSRMVALERARTLLYLGDWSEMPLLIDALESNELPTRALAGYALFRATGESRGFDPKADAEERAQAANAWRTWWRQRNEEGILEQDA